MPELINLIPSDQVLDILERNLIGKALPNIYSKEMLELIIIWKQYIEPDIKVTCGLCYERILKNYKELRPIWVNIHKKINLLASA